MDILEQVQQEMMKMIERLLFEERLRRLQLFSLKAQEKSHHLILAVSLGAASRLCVVLRNIGNAVCKNGKRTKFQQRTCAWV